MCLLFPTGRFSSVQIRLEGNCICSSCTGMEFFLGSVWLLNQDTPSPRQPGIQSPGQLRISSAVGGLEVEKDSDGKDEGRGAGRQKRWRKIKFPAADRATVPHLKHALWNKRRAARRKNRILLLKECLEEGIKRKRVKEG